MNFEEVKEIFKKSIDTTDTMNQAIENFIQSIYLKGYNDALNTVEVKQEPKTGHWIIYDVHGHKACKCSKCDKDVGYPCNDKYCKHCGTKIVAISDITK